MDSNTANNTEWRRRIAPLGCILRDRDGESLASEIEEE